MNQLKRQLLLDVVKGQWVVFGKELPTNLSQGTAIRIVALQPDFYLRIVLLMNHIRHDLQVSSRTFQCFTDFLCYICLLEKLLARFPDVVERARVEYAPQVVANYLINLAGAFNSFYASQTIIDEKDPLSPYRLALTRGFKNIMTEGLWLLGIRVPKKM